MAIKFEDLIQDLHNAGFSKETVGDMLWQSIRTGHQFEEPAPGRPHPVEAYGIKVQHCWRTHVVDKYLYTPTISRRSAPACRECRAPLNAETMLSAGLHRPPPPRPVDDYIIQPLQPERD